MMIKTRLKMLFSAWPRANFYVIPFSRVSTETCLIMCSEIFHSFCYETFKTELYWLLTPVKCIVLRHVSRSTIMYVIMSHNHSWDVFMQIYDAAYLLSFSNVSKCSRRTETTILSLRNASGSIAVKKSFIILADFWYIPWQ